jgi:hypothetical protein
VLRPLHAAICGEGNVPEGSKFITAAAGDAISVLLSTTVSKETRELVRFQQVESSSAATEAGIRAHFQSLLPGFGSQWQVAEPPVVHT